MKNNAKLKPAKGVKLGDIRGPYVKTRCPNGLTPNEWLTTVKAEREAFDLKKEQEHWQTREQAEAAAQETAEIIQSDLYGTIPLALAGKLSGKIFTAQEVRVIIRDEIDLAVRQWVKGERVSAKAIK